MAGNLASESSSYYLHIEAIYEPQGCRSLRVFESNLSANRFSIGSDGSPVPRGCVRGAAAQVDIRRLIRPVAAES